VDAILILLPLRDGCISAPYLYKIGFRSILLLSFLFLWLLVLVFLVDRSIALPMMIKNLYFRSSEVAMWKNNLET